MRCPACKLTRTTHSDKEREKLNQSALIWAEVGDSALTKEAAVSGILALNSKIIARLAFEPLTWTCKSCGAESPAHFHECWKCQRMRENIPKDISDVLPVDFDE